MDDEHLYKNHENNIKKIILATKILALVVGVCKHKYLSHCIKRKELRIHAMEESVASTKNGLLNTNDSIQLTILEDQHIDLDHCIESPMDENEIKVWKSVISTLVGETSKTALNTYTFHGLLKCDVPIKDLCHNKNNPNAMRGYVKTNGKISHHASFYEVGLESAAPLLVYQCMAFVTSQYYQQIITERLNTIDKKLDTITKILKVDDQAKLSTSNQNLQYIKINL